jgi:hypothetical protein
MLHPELRKGYISYGLFLPILLPVWTRIFKCSSDLDQTRVAPYCKLDRESISLTGINRILTSIICTFEVWKPLLRIYSTDKSNSYCQYLERIPRNLLPQPQWRRWLQYIFTRSHGVMSYNIVIFTVAYVRTSNLTHFIFIELLNSSFCLHQFKRLLYNSVSSIIAD